MKHKILYFNIILFVKGVKPVERNASFHDYFAQSKRNCLVSFNFPNRAQSTMNADFNQVFGL